MISVLSLGYLYKLHNPDLRVMYCNVPGWRRCHFLGSFDFCSLCNISSRNSVVVFQFIAHRWPQCSTKFKVHCLKKHQICYLFSFISKHSFNFLLCIDSGWMRLKWFSAIWKEKIKCKGEYEFSSESHHHHIPRLRWRRSKITILLRVKIIWSWKL